MNFDFKRPCPDCPFRSDIKPFIRSTRAEEILTSQGYFLCHKTIKVGDEEGGDWEPILDDSKATHCAGFLILLEKEGAPNQMMRISERLGTYDPNKLDMESPVYDSVAKCIQAHEEAEV